MIGKILEGKVTLIAGADNILGKAIALEFVNRGADLAVAHYNENPAIIREIIKYVEDNDKQSVMEIEIPRINFDCIDSAVSSVKDKFGRIDIFVNNTAGSMCKKYAFPEADKHYKDWSEMVSRDIDGLYYWCKAVVSRAMLAQNKGKIINMATIAGIVGITGTSYVNVSDCAIIGFTKSLARELLKTEVRVNVVTFGLIDLDLCDRDKKRELELIRKILPIQRLGTLQEVVQPVLFLASDMSNFVTGHILNVSGGLLI